jgi:amidase
MARSIDDLALLFSVMAGPDPSSPTALTDPGAGFRAIEPLPSETLKVAYSPDLGGLPVAPEIRERIAQVANQLRDMGVTVEQACPDLRDATRIFHVLRAQSFRARFSYLSAEDQAQLKDTIIWNMQAGQQLTHEDLDQAWVARTALFTRVAEFFRHYDFLLGPTTQVLPFDVETPWVQEIDGVAMEDYLSWMQSCAQLTVTSCPAVSLPVGFSADGLPIGAQLVAPAREDLRLLRFAKALEGEISSAAHPPEICA